ncbi:hypothetical protein [Ornithinibacillus halophilus]|uniref:Uncharacterized protein n=1 Tax=Ornithinibacillus halophilus TaxID=930117 RepID=A0A1M5LK67_9BACI|nr:hypothetical protein [Ornithinibacillus halophilus]SHG65427.1 hypothetical protein SAMN05216225_10488 [Ornithinibacillus halophilus]
MLDKEDGKLGEHIVSIIIAMVIAAILAVYVFDIPTNPGPATYLFN